MEKASMAAPTATDFIIQEQSQIINNNNNKKNPCLFTEIWQILILISEHLLPKGEKSQQSSSTAINPASCTTPAPSHPYHMNSTLACASAFSLFNFDFLHFPS